MEHILLPTSIQFKDTNDSNIGQVIITPCHKGYGTTLGNALRRVLLSSLPGAAVESVKIDGIQHEFSVHPGVQEDTIEIILNLKQLAVRLFSDEPVTLSLVKKGKGAVTAADIEKNADVEIMNLELHIATITDDAQELRMDITVGKGRGYVPVSEKETKHLSLGTISIDSLYTPIRDVGYQVEMTRVGDVTDYEKLTMKIETNMTITPREAIQQATSVLMDHLVLILEATTNEGKSEEKQDALEGEGNKEEMNTETTDTEDSTEEKPSKKKK